jgi:hypothetical protein
MVNEACCSHNREAAPRRPLTEHTDTFLAEIAALLAARQPGDAEPSLARLEETLTAGYARALELEAGRLRIQRRIAELTARLGDAANGSLPSEVAALSRRATQVDSEIRTLRASLQCLRVRASALRAAGAAVVL